VKLAKQNIRRVFMVDDDADIRKICNVSLSSVGGWEVTLAASGPEALEKLAIQKPDVILLDVMMPGMDGPTTYAKIKELPGGADVPVILITAKVQQHELEKYTKLGVAGVIMKPFDPMTLPNQVISLLDSWYEATAHRKFKMP
jgi:CheY-like chemotaxis protein